MNENNDLGTRLAAGLHEEAERVRPESALQLILARTRRPRRSRCWWPALAGAVVAGGLVAAALVVFTPEPTNEPPVADQPARPVTVYMIQTDPGAMWDEASLVPDEVMAPDTGDRGVDAVNALFATAPTDPDYINVWTSLGSNRADNSLELVAPVVVSGVSEADGVIYVNFTGPVDNPWQGIVDWVVDPGFFTQQLVWTVQDALNSHAPVIVTRDGERLNTLLTAPLHNPVARDDSMLAAVQIESPEQGETLASPVTVWGQSATFEANVVWRVKQDGETVARGFTTSKGANGVFGPFSFTVDLPPGDYTVEAFEESAENGDIINLDSKDFTVG